MRGENLKKGSCYSMYEKRGLEHLLFCKLTVRRAIVQSDWKISHKESSDPVKTVQWCPARNSSGVM